MCLICAKGDRSLSSLVLSLWAVAWWKEEVLTGPCVCRRQKAATVAEQFWVRWAVPQRYYTVWRSLTWSGDSFKRLRSYLGIHRTGVCLPIRRKTNVISPHLLSWPTGKTTQYRGGKEGYWAKTAWTGDKYSLRMLSSTLTVAGFAAIKATVSQDFLLLVLFKSQFPPSPRVFH